MHSIIVRWQISTKKKKNLKIFEYCYTIADNKINNFCIGVFNIKII